MDEKNQGAGAPDAAPSKEDPIHNLKQEMNRKLGNLEQSNAQLMAYIDQLNKAAAQKQPPAQEKPAKKLSEVWFDDPEQAAREIEERTERRIQQRLNDERAATQKQQSVLNQLIQEFPELSDTGHDLHKKTIEIYNALSDEDKTTPLAYKAAAKEAALELGIKPKRLRSKEDDDGFSLSSSNAPARAERKAQKEAENVTSELAKAFGLEMTPERKARLQNKHGRKSYNHWE